MTPRLTEEEEAQSLVGPTFANVTPEMIFSASADAVLAAQVRKLNPKPGLAFGAQTHASGVSIWTRRKAERARERGAREA